MRHWLIQQLSSKQKATRTVNDDSGVNKATFEKRKENLLITLFDYTWPWSNSSRWILSNVVCVKIFPLIIMMMRRIKASWPLLIIFFFVTLFLISHVECKLIKELTTEDQFYDLFQEPMTKSYVVLFYSSRKYRKQTMRLIWTLAFHSLSFHFILLLSPSFNRLHYLQVHKRRD